MRIAALVTAVLALATVVAALPATHDSISEMTTAHMGRDRRPCDGRCITRGNTERRATRTCNRAPEPCVVETCVRNRGRGRNARSLNGHRCVITEPTETVTASGTPVPSDITTPTTAPSTTPSSSPVAAPTSMAPSPTTAPIMIPIVGPPIEGPVEAPESITFPDEIVVGGTVDVEVTVNLNEVSSSLQEDIYFLTDATASMTEEIASAQRRFGDLVRARQNASIDVAFGVGFYRDEEDVMNFRNVQPITKNIAAVNTAIDSLRAEGTSDNPEANLFALNQVATLDSIGWRVGSRKILVYMGDAPGHEPTCPTGSDPITREAVIAQLNEKGIAVVGTNFGTKINGGLNAPTESASGPTFGCAVSTATRPRQASDITSATLGALELASDPRMLIDVITETIESLDQELDATTMDCAGRVDITFTPELPLSVESGATTTISERAVIMPAACEFPDGFTCKIDLVLSGVGVRQIIQTTSIAGCVPDDGSGFL